jgi:hypothetical protein
MPANKFINGFKRLTFIAIMQESSAQLGGYGELHRLSWQKYNKN